MRTIALLSFLLSACIAHSYVECADWRFNDPAKPGWTANDGRCFGYARRWPRGKYPNYTFGNFDNVWFAWIQNPNNQSNSCSPTNGGSNYGIQSRTANIMDSYAPNNADYGAMTSTHSGATLCFTWSARNHASGGETCYDHSNPSIVCPLDINWATTPGTDPTQPELSNMRVGARLSYQNCTAGNQNPATNSCGGCFTVPQRNPGIYTVQWRWGLNGAMGKNTNEVYSSCIDINVLPSDTTPTTATANPTTATATPQSSAALASSAPTSAASRASSSSAARSSSSRALSSAQISSSRAASSAQASRSSGASSALAATSAGSGSGSGSAEPGSVNTVIDVVRDSSATLMTVSAIAAVLLIALLL